ncbi:hypothetical protein ACWZEH_27010 [Streptomyces sp. QTS137]
MVITGSVSDAVDHGRLVSIRVIVPRPSENWIRLGAVDRSEVVPAVRTGSDGDRARRCGPVVTGSPTERSTGLYHWGKRVRGELKCGPSR